MAGRAAQCRLDARFGALRVKPGWPALLVLMWAISPTARAQTPEDPGFQPRPRIVLLQPQTGPGRPGLEPSLRIQLRELELITLRVELPADVPSRLSTASKIAEQQSADWVVWADDLQTDPSKPADQAVLYLVGRREGRALIEVVRVPGGEGPEVDRSLALKVDELVGARDGAAYALGNKELPKPIEAKSASERRVGLSLEAGAQASDEGSAGLSADAFIAVGPSLMTPSFVLAVPIELAIGFARGVERDGANVSWRELGVGGWLKLAARVHPRLALGGGLGGRVTFTDAEGSSASGRTGSSTERLPGLLASLDAELTLSPAIATRLALGVEQRLRRQRLYIEAREMADTGRTVLFARLSFAWHVW